jgi:hypothetical protein
MRGPPVLLLLALLLLVPPPAAAQVLFRVNTYTPGPQENPAIAPDPNGGFVVVWESIDQDGDYIGVFGQRFDGAGARAGSEFRVNQYVFGPQQLPAVTALDDGGFVVAWQGYGEGGDYGDIFARRFDANGTAAGSEFQVNEAVPEYEVGAAVAATSDGGFVVVWDDYDDVFARRYDGAGMAVGAPVVANDITFGTQAGAAVGGLPDGGFVVVWSDGYYLSDGQDGFGYGVFGRRFDSAGEPQGSEFQINAATLGDQYGAAVAVGAAGGFVVVWQSYGHEGNQSALFARRYDSGGLPQGSEFEVSAFTGYRADPPQVAVDAANAFAVTWAVVPRAGGAAVALVRRFDSGGAALGAAERVEVQATDDQLEPAIGALSGASFVVVWRGDGVDGDGSGIVANILDATPGAPTATATPGQPMTATPSPTATVAGPSVTATATTTSTAPTGTPSQPATPSASNTPTPGATMSATSTPQATMSTTATPDATATPSETTDVCAGDCNRNGVVTVDDLILGVNIALGNQPISRCTAADRDGNGQIAVSELITAVNRALGGCA